MSKSQYYGGENYDSLYHRGARFYQKGKGWIPWADYLAGKKNWRRPHYRSGVKSYIKKVVRGMGETKFIDTSISSIVPVAGTSEIHLLSGVAEGLTNVTRVGETIEIESIQVQGYIQGDPNVTFDTLAKIVLFRANENVEGVMPTVTDVLMADTVQALHQIDNRGDFKVYLNQVIRLPMRAAAADTIIPKEYFKYYKKLNKPKPAHFDGATAAIADCEKGHWFLMLMTNQANTFQPAFYLECRINFKDV